jgi:hypothetical protein
MKRPYQILTKAAITAVVFTAIPSFAAQVPAAVPAKEISLNYVSPLMKAIELENELERSAKSPVEVAMPTQPVVRAQNCINGNVAFNAENLTNGFEFKPYPYLTITLGKVQGSVTAWGQYCFNGSWRANGSGAVTVKNEVFVGLNSGNWRYFNNNNLRYKIEFGLKGEANIGATGNFDFSANSQSYEQASLNFDARGDLIASFVTPRLTIERWTYNGGSGSFSWVQLGLNGPTNGRYVDGISFEMSAYGALTFTGGYRWRGWDNDPDSSRDSEQQRWLGSITGRAGVKLKFKNVRGQEFESSLYWSAPLVGSGVSVNSGDQHVRVSDATDAELDKRPR